MSQKLTQSQVVEQRTTLLNGYNQIRTQIQKREEQLINSQSPQKLTEMIISQNRLFENVNTPATLSHDCQTLNKITEIAVSQISAINLGPKSMTFANVRSQIMNKFSQGNNINWEAFGEFSLRRSKVAPRAVPVIYGLGEFQEIHRSRKVGVRHKDVVGELQSVGNKDLSNVQSTHLLAKAVKLYNKLQNEGAIPLSKIMISEDSFGQTVENAFEFAHLVRDGKVGIQQQGNHVMATADTNGIGTSDRRQQCVLHLRQGDYKKVIEHMGSQV